MEGTPPMSFPKDETGVKLIIIIIIIIISLFLLVLRILESTCKHCYFSHDSRVIINELLYFGQFRILVIIKIFQFIRIVI